MKKFLIIAVLLLLVASMAWAGVLGEAKGWLVENALGALLTLFFMVIAGFFGGTKVGQILLKAKVPIYDLKEVLIEIHNARKPSSPGGVKTTEEEKDAILKKVENLIASVVNVFGKKAA